MSKQTVDSKKLRDNADSLHSFLELIREEHELYTVYIKDSEGNDIGYAVLEEETLTDGSKVYNLILQRDK